MATVHSSMTALSLSGLHLRVKQIACSPRVSAPVLVFLHEGLGCIDMWKDVPEAICARTGCDGIVSEREGYGQSDGNRAFWPRDYLTQAAAHYLPALLADRHIAQAILIGHSDGGTIALLAAGLNGERIRGVVTLAAHIFVEEVTLAGIRRTVQAYATTDLREKLHRYHGPTTDQVFYRWANRWLDPAFRTWDIQDVLPQVRCPVLVMQGEDDEYATPAQVTGIAAGVCGPVTTRMLPACGHVPHFQAREMVMDHISAFVQSLRTP